MIQIRRGKTNSWKKLKKPLAAGQPGYDKDKHKIKIGDGESSWVDLPDSSGLRMEEILISEEDAKKRAKGLLSPLELLRKMLKLADRPVITYGTEHPDKNTVGQVYLQHYDTEPETDYIIDYGVDGIWTYQRWHSGLVRCWGSYSLKTAVSEQLENSMLYLNNTKMEPVAYPASIAFIAPPVETATVHSPGGLVWLASTGENTDKHSATYRLLSVDNHSNSAKYSISICVNGYCKK